VTPVPDFLTARLGAKGWPVFRLGLSTTNRPGERTVRAALDQGVNYLFGYAIDTNLNNVVRGMNADQRGRVLIATGGYNWIFYHTPLKKSLENALKRLKTDYIDVFHFLSLIHI
jgi:aryl-alcohol dehydrogenase-like predicted oxidoreductase